jgi:translation initiation factor IF-2
VVLGEQQAKEILEYRKERLRAKEAMTAVTHASDPAAAANVTTKPELEKTLNVVLKADIGGTLQAGTIIQPCVLLLDPNKAVSPTHCAHTDRHACTHTVESTLNQFPQDEVKLRIIRAAVGDISSTDIGLAKDTGAVVLGFNVPPINSTLELARVEKVDVNNFSIIYQLADEVKRRLESMLPPREVEEEVGRGDVLSVFSVTMPNREQHNVAGLRIVRGSLDSRLRVRLLRRNKSVDADEEFATLYDGPIESLKKFKDDITTAKKGDECGLALRKWNDLRPGDLITCYRMKQVPRKLGDPK